MSRNIDASRDKVFRARTITKAETDVRAGGASLIVMRSPEGEEYVVARV